MSIDYTKFKDANDPAKRVEPDKENPNPTIRWWKCNPGSELADAVAGQVAALAQADKQRIWQYNLHARLYSNQSNPVSNMGYTLTTVNSNPAPQRERIAYNLVQSCVDTLTSKMAKNKVRPFFLTAKGNSKQQRKAQKLNDFTAGVFYENEAYRKMPVGFRDGGVWGDGLIRVFNNHGRVKWKRVLPYQILVDYLETHEGPENAKTLHFIMQVDRATLASLMPKNKDAISHLDGTNQYLSNTQRSVSDMVMVVESWRLPSEPDADDGLHCITAPGRTLFWEPYSKGFFPFGHFRYSPRLQGYWGQGLAEQLVPIQTELNRCLMSVQRSFHLGGTFKVLLHNTSKIVKTHIDNSIGAIIYWAGDHPPQYITPPMVQPEIYQQIQTLKMMGYEQAGISQLSASAAKPAGLNSGEAQRVYHDIETDRFQWTGQAYENLGLELAMLSIDTARDIEKEGKSVTVSVPGKRFIDSIDWADVNLERDEYVMQCFPESKLPSDPEGRLSTIQEMMQAGLIDPETGRRLLDYPDLDAEEQLANALLDYLHKILDGIVEDGDYTPPDPAVPPLTGLKLAMEYYWLGQRDNLEEGRLGMLRDFIGALGRSQQAAQAALPQGQPQAVPAPAPTSNLLPNVPGAA